MKPIFVTEPISGVVYRTDAFHLEANGLKVTLEALAAETVRDAEGGLILNEGQILAADTLTLDSHRRRVEYVKTVRACLKLADDAEGPTERDLWDLRQALMAQLGSGHPADEDADEWQPSEEALITARELLNAPDLLQLVGVAIERQGLAGGLDPAKTVYLGFTSRLLQRPLNLVVTGPSSAGKSFLVNVVAKLFPSSAYVALTGMSERVLLYTDTNLQHRILIIAEASALSADGFGASLMRSITWDAEIRYQVTEQIDGKYVGRTIVKPGPTGLTTTTTKRVESELDNRMLTIHLSDTPEQTRIILRATASRLNGTPGEEPDLEPFHALQWVLAHEGGNDVFIPYAVQLGELVPDRQVRMRRDFTQILTLIKAHALLHQYQRGRDDQGRIIADHQDYAAIYGLTGGLFTAIAAEGATPAIREAVDAVRQLTPGKDDTTTNAAVEKVLGIDKEATKKRIGKALSAGWVVNTESRRGRPGQLRIGDAMPADSPVLPDPARLFENHIHTHLPSSPVRQSGFSSPEADKVGISQEFPTSSPAGSGDSLGNLPKSPVSSSPEAESGQVGNWGTEGVAGVCSPTGAGEAEIELSDDERGYGTESSPISVKDGRTYMFNPDDPFNERKEVNHAPTAPMDDE